jgi:putative two-component system hydrogenase maturation factor HypX/HoxX
LSLSSNRLNKNYRVFGAHLEQAKSFNSPRYEPGQIIAQRHGAILVKCGEGALWLSHVKKNKLKLPATSWLKHDGIAIPSLPEPNMEILNETHPSTFQV